MLKGVEGQSMRAMQLGLYVKTLNSVACGELIARRQIWKQEGNYGNGRQPEKKDVDLDEFGGVRILRNQANVRDYGVRSLKSDMGGVAQLSWVMRRMWHLRGKEQRGGWEAGFGVC